MLFCFFHDRIADLMTWSGGGRTLFIFIVVVHPEN